MDEHESAKLAYAEASGAHKAIADFRAKLLALLPIASGAGIFLLLDGDRRPPAADLAAVGVFGFVVTLGLFMYELRGIQQCRRLRDQASALEDALGFPPGTAPFRDRTDARLDGIAGAEGAGWIVYTAVMAAWLYVAGSGGLWDDGRALVLVCLYVAVLGFALSRLRRRRRRRLASGRLGHRAA